MERESLWLRLVHAPGIGPAGCTLLLNRFGGIDGLVSASRNALRDAGVAVEAIEVLRGESLPDNLQTDLDWAGQAGCHLLTADHPDWPPLLAAIANPPPVLYVRGDPELLRLPGLAVVGSRNPTTAGRESAHDFARHLAAAGLVINSGMALGIDAAAHMGALAAGGMTVAVTGTGLDRIYPSRHAELARQIAADGALVSEFPLGTSPHPGNFPQRNRIITGLSLGTLVVEAATRSGSLISARHAMEQGRDVFAIPGSIHNPLARGCHQLIRQGAKLVEKAEDVLEELGPQLDLVGRATRAEHAEAKPSAEDAGMAQDPEYNALLTVIDWEPRGVDELAERTGLAVSAVASMLLRLELEGHVRAVPGGLYQRPG